MKTTITSRLTPVRTRDDALICIGKGTMVPHAPKTDKRNLREGYALLNEGPYRYRSLPYVQAYGLKCYYRESE